MKRKQAQIGSVSSGSLISDDLIMEFAYELRTLRGSLPRGLSNAVNLYYRAWQMRDVTDDASELVNALIDALQEYAPPYCYFGAHPGDGADFGFWPCEDIEHDFDGLQVSDTSEVPRNYSGDVLHINDHGNVTIYAARRGKLRELVAFV